MNTYGKKHTLNYPFVYLCREVKFYAHIFFNKEKGIEQQAIFWFIKMQGDYSLSSRKKFELWMRNDYSHRQHYQKIRSCWDFLDAYNEKEEIKQARQKLMQQSKY